MTISHMPLYKKLKERIKEGAIGNTKMVQVNFGSNKGYDSTQRFFALEAAGGAYWILEYMQQHLREHFK